MLAMCFSILSIMLLHGSFQVLYGDNKFVKNTISQNTGAAADVTVTDVKSGVVNSPNPVSIVPHQTYNVPRINRLEATLLVVKTQEVVSLTMIAFEGNFPSLTAFFTQDGDPVDAGNGLNTLHFKATIIYPAERTEFHVTSIKADIVTNVKTITQSFPLDGVKVVVASSKSV